MSRTNAPSIRLKESTSTSWGNAAAGKGERERPMNNPWVLVSLLGIAIFGFAWLSSGRGREDHSQNAADPAYDRLLEDLETENRELLDAVSKFKQEQDGVVKGLVKQIVGLERQVATLAEQSAAFSLRAAELPAGLEIAAAALPSAPIEVSQAAASPAATPAAEPEQAAEEESRHPASIRERYAELLTLHENGRSVEQIAKAVGMNKGEVQLILQLARREEEQLA